MSKMHQADPLTSEEWADRLAPARRLARFKAHLERARKAVQADPPLTEAERSQIAQIWLDGPDGRSQTS